MAGTRLKAGAVVGATNANGTAVTDREVDHGHLLHTYLRAVGVDSKGEFCHRWSQVADRRSSKSAIEEILA